MKKNRGFTLVELLIVIAIIAVLAMVLVPVLSAQVTKSRKRVCEHNRAEIQRAYSIEKQLAEDAANSDVLEKTRKEVFESKDTVCPVGGGAYKYQYYNADGAATGPDSSDGIGVRVTCVTPGHGSSSVQLAQQSIGEWISNYRGTAYGNNVVDAYVREHDGKGYLLSDAERAELFGANYSFAEDPENLYLKPLGATVYKDGKPQVLDIQMITNIPGGVGSAGDMKTYALIIEGRVYVMKDKNGQLQGSYRIGGNGPQVLELIDYNSNPGKGIYNKDFSSVETFIEQITKSNRDCPFQPVD